MTGGAGCRTPSRCRCSGPSYNRVPGTLDQRGPSLSDRAMRGLRRGARFRRLAPEPAHLVIAGVQDEETLAPHGMADLGGHGVKLAVEAVLVVMSRPQLGDAIGGDPRLDRDGRKVFSCQPVAVKSSVPLIPPSLLDLFRISGLGRQAPARCRQARPPA